MFKEGVVSLDLVLPGTNFMAGISDGDETGIEISELWEDERDPADDLEVDSACGDCGLNVREEADDDAVGDRGAPDFGD